MTHPTSDNRSLPPHWVSFSDTNPPDRAAFYWLLSSYGDTRLAHYDGMGGWRGVNAGGQSFKLQDVYTHWTPVPEPSV